MKNSNPKIVEIKNPGGNPIWFTCKKCGKDWSPMIKPGSHGKFYRGSWQCPNGCKP